MTIYLREWRAKDGTLKQAFRYDFSFRKPGELKARRYKGTVPGRSLNRRLAESYERALITKVMSGDYDAERAAAAKPKMPSLTEFANEFIKTCEGVGSGCGEREVRDKRTILRRYLVPFFGPDPLDRIITARIDAFMASQLVAPKPKGKVGFKVKTITNHVTVLSGLLRLAFDRGILDRMPKINWPKIVAPPPRFYTFEQAGALIEASKAEPFWEGMILVALRCGLRIGELQALEWRHVDLRAKTINVVQTFSKTVLKWPKNRRTRAVPMPPSVVEALSRHPRRLGSPWVWPSADGDALKQNEVKHPMWRALERAGLPPDQWHICRHTFCSHLVMRGVHLLAVMQLAGHSSFAVTLRYAHLAPNIHADAVAKLDEEVSVVPKPAEETTELRKRRS